jgi:hypothetical protein
MEMDRHHKIHSFEEIGMTNPFSLKKKTGNLNNLNTSIDMAIMNMKVLRFAVEVYPSSVTRSLTEAIRTGKPCRPPKCVFVPEKHLIRIMIKSVLKYGNYESKEDFLLRFGILGREMEQDAYEAD